MRTIVSIPTNLLFSRNYVKRLIQNNCIGSEEVQTVTNLTAKPCLKCIINLTENDKYFAVFLMVSNKIVEQ